MPPHAPAQPGRPYPLGATWDGEGVNFAVFSAHATRVLLCFFDSPESDIESRFVELTARTNQVWHAYVPGIQPGQLYGYRVDGPYAPLEGHRFNGQKVLFDPYAKAVGRTMTWDDSVFGFPALGGLPQSPDAVNQMDDRDSAPFAPLSSIVDTRFDWQGDQRPQTPWRDTVIYELHVKGFTQLHPGVPEELRGTYRGLASKAAIAHFRSLGVTAVELLPVHHHVDEAHLQRLGLKNYWGYNTLGFFAPEPAYAGDTAPDGVVREFKEMVRGLHAASIEVLLDVVYNHTCEGNERGPTVCWRGLDNASYYRLQKNRARNVNYTGVGNTIDTRRPQALRMILDSLRYWVEEMHVDGFRFDLCSALGRESDAFDPGSGFFDAIFQDPTLAQVKLIAEPWDIDPSGYQVGGYPTGWSEWNGKYRDQVRQFWRGDDFRLGPLATRFAGSSDLFNHSGRSPRASVNFITAHDGFTLHDLVTYERKRNMANGEHNRDGDSHNNSRNYGVEGPTDNPKINAVRSRQKRNFLATMALSSGVPMLTAGDEMGRTQLGNNNAYCQDNELSWLSWDLDDSQNELLDFTRRLLELRRSQPALTQRRFYTGEAAFPGAEIKDIAWYSPTGHEMRPAEWSEPTRNWIGILIGPASEGGDPLLFLLNAAGRAIDFRLPPVSVGGHWEVLFDTADQTPATTRSMVDTHYEVAAHAFVALRRIADLE